MPLNRILLSIPLVVVALVVQVSVLARLQLPGAVPDLLLLTVIALALVYGHTGGALVGFGAGLLADLAPPADHAVGRYALVLCVIGYAAGLTKPESGQQHRSATVPMLVVAGAALSSTLLYAGVGALVGDTAARHVGLGGLLLTATVYDLLLAPFTVPLIMALARRSEHDPLAETAGGGPADRSRRYDGALGPGGPRPGFGRGLGGGLRGGFRLGGKTRTTRLSGTPAGKPGGGALRTGGWRAGLLPRTARSRVGRIKGVKRL